MYPACWGHGREYHDSSLPDLPPTLMFPPFSPPSRPVILLIGMSTGMTTWWPLLTTTVYSRFTQARGDWQRGKKGASLLQGWLSTPPSKRLISVNSSTNWYFTSLVAHLFHLTEGITKCQNEQIMKTVIHFSTTYLLKHRLHVSTHH